MSDEVYQKFQFDCEVYSKLKEAETEAVKSAQRFSHQEVFTDLRETLQAKVKKTNNLDY